MPPSLYNSLIEKLEGHPYSNYFSCWCPFDKHKSPALLVYDDGLFVCLSCGKKGTHKFLDRYIGSHFRPQQTQCQPSRVLPQWRRWEQKYDDLEGIVYHAHRSLKRQAMFQSFFKARKILEYVDEGNCGYLDGWVLFPVYDDRKKLLDVVVRATSGKGDTRYVVAPRDDRGIRPLYVPSWQKVNNADTVYVVYGVIDAISLHLSGLPSVTGVTGKSLHADVLLPLRKRFVIVPDEGEEQEAHKLANQLGWRARVKELEYPDNVKDPDGLRKMFGSSYLQEILI